MTGTSKIKPSRIGNFAQRSYARWVGARANSVLGSELASRLAGGAFWTLVGGVASQSLALFASVSVARLLGREVFGEFGMIRCTAMMFSTFAGFGLGLTATKHIAEFRTRAPERAGRMVALSILFALGAGTVMAMVVCLSAPLLARYAMDAPHLAGLLRVGSLLLLLNTLNGVQAGGLAGFEAFKTMTRVNVAVGLISVPVLVVATYIAGLSGALWAVVINLCVQVLLNQWALRVEASRASVSLDYRSCFREWNVLWSFSLPAALSSMLSAPAIWICHAFLVNQTGGYAEMGLFNAANQWRMAILFVPQKVCMVALPVLSNLVAEGQMKRFKDTVKMCAGITAIASIVVATPVMLLSWWIMRAYGRGFVSGASTLCLLAVSAILMAVSFVGGQAIAALGRVWFRFLVHVLWSLTLVGSAWALVAHGGDASGLALVNVIAYGVHCLAQYGLLMVAMRREKRRPDTQQHGAPLVPAERLAA